MDEFVYELILAYFKDKKDEYSFRELASDLGLSVSSVTKYIQDLISYGDLEYVNSMLCISLQGRVRIQNKPVDYFTFNYETAELEVDNIAPRKQWPLDKVYFPIGFMEKYNERR
ncbi:MAG: winged helix-turn-helix domain-containing protein [Clostridia bacterium]|nr:winged helix-turn-helix domain-containing protein [Clostridia bacterium]